MCIFKAHTRVFYVYVPYYVYCAWNAEPSVLTAASMFHQLTLHSKMRLALCHMRIALLLLFDDNEMKIAKEQQKKNLVGCTREGNRWKGNIRKGSREKARRKPIPSLKPSWSKEFQIGFHREASVSGTRLTIKILILFFSNLFFLIKILILFFLIFFSSNKNFNPVSGQIN